MEWMQIVGPILGMVFVIVTILFFLSWLERFSWYRCLFNWLHYRRWIPCRHAVKLFRGYGPLLPHTPEAEVLEAFCQECGTVFIRDTRKNVEAEIDRVLLLAQRDRAVKGE